MLCACIECMNKDWKIREGVLFNVLRASRHAHPNEFIALLSLLEKDSKLIGEIVVTPSESGRDYAGLHSHLIPLDPLIVGTVHSHPSHSPFPSEQDLVTFSKMGEIHLIVCRPYSPDTLRAFNAKGRPIPIEVV